MPFKDTLCFVQRYKKGVDRVELKLQNFKFSQIKNTHFFAKYLAPVRCQTKVHNLTSNKVWGFSYNY